MTKVELLKLLEYVEDDVEILARDPESQTTYEFIGLKPTRTLDMICLVLKQQD